MRTNSLGFLLVNYFLKTKRGNDLFVFTGQVLALN